MTSDRRGKQSVAAWLVTAAPLPRRLVTVPTYVFAWTLLTALLPPLLLVAAAIGALRQRGFIVLRLTVFLWIYLGLALTMLARLLVARIGSKERRDERVADASRWYGSSLLHRCVQLLSMSILVESEMSSFQGPLVVLVRHVSIVDAVFPASFLATRGLVLRYVLKKELALEPCIDITGHMGRHCFLDRDGPPRRELRKVADLARDLASDAVVIFPEGTRFTESKRVETLELLRHTEPELASVADSMTHVLPPKIAGMRRLLSAAPRADCLIIAHRGLEGLAKPSDFLDGSIVGRQIIVRIQRIGRDRIPQPRGDAQWLFAKWREVDDFAAGRHAGDA